jgi:1-deoxy-D-xylulose-5-phosphate reductoisomerase
MINKGFEVMEAMWLFNAKREDVDVVIHKESIVHSMVEFQDGAIIAQMGVPSMELPIQLALTYPERFNIENNTLNLVGKTLTFDSVDINRYPCFDLANVAIKNSYNYPCALSAGDEEVVKLFLQGKIKYTEIPIYLDYVLQKTSKLEVTFENLEYTDKEARNLVYDYYAKRGSV